MNDPIYYVIFLRDQIHPYNMYGVCTIVKVIESTFEEVDNLWKEYVRPLQESGQFMPIETRIIRREPANPIKDWKEVTDE